MAAATLSRLGVKSLDLRVWALVGMHVCVQRWSGLESLFRDMADKEAGGEAGRKRRREGDQDGRRQAGVIACGTGIYISATSTPHLPNCLLLNCLLLNFSFVAPSGR